MCLVVYVCFLLHLGDEVHVWRTLDVQLKKTLVEALASVHYLDDIRAPTGILFYLYGECIAVVSHFIN